MTRLETRDLTLAYDGPPVVDGLTLDLPDGQVTSIIGPNGCGKSTLLRALARLNRPTSGAAVLDGEAVHRQPTKEVARRLGLLPQGAQAPDAITVEDLVRRGRFPHQSFFTPPTDADQIAVNRALELAGVEHLRNRAVDELSGGQRQRAWIAMSLAQETSLLLLDEPTTYLDIAHQEEVLELIRYLNEHEGKTIAMVLHDVNEAARYSDHVIAMRNGAVVALGTPAEVINPDTVQAVFGVSTEVITDPHTGAPVCLPCGDESTAACRMADDCPIALAAHDLTLAYDKRIVSAGLDVNLPEGVITAIIGPNACGKSTLLRALSRLLSPRAGQVLLGEDCVRDLGRRGFAQRVGLLPQAPAPPMDVTVEELVASGRAPYQRWWRQWSDEDETTVEAALKATGMVEFRDRTIDALSGGQRQRAWLAMALARRTPVMLLDEPTTYLDIAHQVDVLDLVRALNTREHTTVVMVLHDLSQACRYADNLVVMKDGEIVATGHPSEVVTADLVRSVFGVEASVVTEPVTGRPLVFPRNAVNGRYRNAIIEVAPDEEAAPVAEPVLSGAN